MLWLSLVLAAAASALAALLGTRLVLRELERRAILDHPNRRSSHAEPTPRGGGLAVMTTVLVAWTIVAWATPAAARNVLLVAAVALGLAGISWLDDLRGLRVTVRLLAHVVAVVVGLRALPEPGLVFQGLLPPAVDNAAAGLLWLWFINLFNFMDGIDGIAGAEAASIGVGVALVVLVAGLAPEAAFLALTLTGAAAGFLRWNWPPARIFLGDVGSVPLGFLLGWLLLATACTGLWAAALLLPLYYLADATITLGRRLSLGERIWEAHRSHFYQRAARALGSHAPVTTAVLMANAGLVALAVLAAAGPTRQWIPLVLGGVVTAALLWYLAHPGASDGG